MISSKTQITVRFAETDAMGVVYHANYLPWCECARIDLIEKLGLSYVKLSDSGIHLPVIEACLKYKNPARFGDTVEISASIREKPGVRIKIEYEMRANGKLLLVGHTVHAFVNELGIPIKPPKEFAGVIMKAFDGKL